MTQKDNPPVSKDEAGTLTPRIDVLETAGEIVVHADMPGVKADGVDIRFENGELSVHGRRAAVERSEETANYYRSFRVTERIAADRIEAALKNGVLTLKLPKVEAVKPRRIEVKG